MDDRNGLRDDLLGGRARIGVWGNGFIGFSTLANFANNGVEGIGYDIDEEIVETINEGSVPIDTLEHWLGFDTDELVQSGLMGATTDHTELLAEDVRVHFVCVPTERDGEPWAAPLRETVDRIRTGPWAETEESVLLIIESTLTPGMAEAVVRPTFEASEMVVGEDVFFGVAPRRDWFTSPDKSLSDIPRVFGGVDGQATEEMSDVLGIVTEDLIEATDHEHAEMVKSVENAYRHMGITLANQLARAYPDRDVREVLELAATKWNIPAYYPSVGVGGYCIPLSSKYVLSGATNEEELSLLREAVRSDNSQPAVVAEAVAGSSVETVTILGLAYKGDVKVDVLSPTIDLVEEFQRHGVDVRVNDPYFDDDYVEEKTGAASVDFPNGLTGTEAVIIAAGHRRYHYTQHDKIIDRLEECSLVLDSPRVWDDVDFRGSDIEYYYTGAKGWLGES